MLPTPDIDPYLTEADHVVIRNLISDAQQQASSIDQKFAGRLRNTVTGTVANGRPPPCVKEEATIDLLQSWNNPKSEAFKPTIFLTWDEEQLPEWLKSAIVEPYVRIASKVARNPTDVVFVTHILLYLLVNVPSAILLFHDFSWLQGIVHAVFTVWCAGPYTLLMHNHIHNDGVLTNRWPWSWLDLYVFPYWTQPLMGHTWNSYYHHHVKHHHVEGNGPDDLSSTIRYQRDSAWHFLHYYLRFMFLIWLELPLYFWRKGRTKLAVRAAVWEGVSMSFVAYMTRLNWRASLFVFLIPLLAMRLAMMAGNWGQHALVDEVDPDSSYRSSITLIDVPSNRFSFNDGYHTSHHLNPRRHWREHPVHLLQSKAAYTEGRALVFCNIDYIMMTVKLLQKDYMHLASCLIPLGEQQAKMSQREIADMLRTKTKQFTEEDIRRKFKPPVRGTS